MEVDDRLDAVANRMDSARRRFHGGSDIPGMCGRCSNSHIYKTPRENFPLVFCTYSEKARQMPLDITECNKFSQIGRLDIWDLAKLAVPIDIDRPKMGFNKEDTHEQPSAGNR
jgi:hypothetical protein